MLSVFIFQMNVDSSDKNSPEGGDDNDDDDDNDDHYCLKCKTIIRGLSHYIEHRKTKCVRVVEVIISQSVQLPFKAPGFIFISW